MKPTLSAKLLGLFLMTLLIGSGSAVAADGLTLGVPNSVDVTNDLLHRLLAPKFQTHAEQSGQNLMLTSLDISTNSRGLVAVAPITGAFMKLDVAAGTDVAVAFVSPSTSDDPFLAGGFYTLRLQEGAEGLALFFLDGEGVAVASAPMDLKIVDVELPGMSLELMTPEVATRLDLDAQTAEPSLHGSCWTSTGLHGRCWLFPKEPTPEEPTTALRAQ